MKNEKHLGLRIDTDLLRKFRFICMYERRSANAQILVLMRKFIALYEKEHGTIEFNNDTQNH